MFRARPAHRNHPPPIRQLRHITGILAHRSRNRGFLRQRRSKPRQPPPLREHNGPGARGPRSQAHLPPMLPPHAVIAANRLHTAPIRIDQKHFRCFARTQRKSRLKQHPPIAQHIVRNKAPWQITQLLRTRTIQPRRLQRKSTCPPPRIDEPPLRHPQRSNQIRRSRQHRPRLPTLHRNFPNPPRVARALLPRKQHRFRIERNRRIGARRETRNQNLHPPVAKHHQLRALRKPLPSPQRRQ